MYGSLPEPMVAEALACNDGVKLCRDSWLAGDGLSSFGWAIWKTREKNRSIVLPILLEIQEPIGIYACRRDYESYPIRALEGLRLLSPSLSAVILDDIEL